MGVVSAYGQHEENKTVSIWRMITPLLQKRGYWFSAQRCYRW